mgnify:CR=1 FL=1
MSKRLPLVLACAVVCVLALAPAASAQYTPWLYWTFLPQAQTAEIVGEPSGEPAWSPMMK